MKDKSRAEMERWCNASGIHRRREGFQTLASGNWVQGFKSSKVQEFKGSKVQEFKVEKQKPGAGAGSGPGAFTGKERDVVILSEAKDLGHSEM